jgi:hypothetical protein
MRMRGIRAQGFVRDTLRVADADASAHKGGDDDQLDTIDVAPN